MAGGLVALLDDIAVLAKLAAASIDDVGAAAGRASVKAAGVVVDDTAVTPQYVRGLAAERELPIIRKIAMGSIRNKLLFILPAALLLSQHPTATPAQVKASLRSAADPLPGKRDGAGLVQVATQLVTGPDGRSPSGEDLTGEIGFDGSSWSGSSWSG